MEWNGMEWNGMEWNEMKRNETKRNVTKRNETKPSLPQVWRRLSQVKGCPAVVFAVLAALTDTHRLLASRVSQMSKCLMV
jgi:hypothetical protein